MGILKNGLMAISKFPIRSATAISIRQSKKMKRGSNIEPFGVQNYFGPSKIQN